MAVAGDLINGALRLLGVLAEGETPSASTSQDALVAFDQMIDSWNTERLTVFCTQDQTVNWVANTSSQTLGPTGTLGVGMTRPVSLDDSTYFRDPGNDVSYPLKLINRAQYDAVALKDTKSNYPQVLFFNNTEPNSTVYLFPVPTTLIEMHFISVQEISQPLTLTTVLSLPDGYLRAVRYNLAVELAAEFGTEPSPTVARIANESKQNIKRINNPNDEMSMPATLVSNNTRFNIFTGQ